MIAGWSPGIGDPTVVGWVTVANYCLGAYACQRAVQVDESNKRMWAALAICLVLLAINKQLDLQALFVGIGRETAKLGGWFERRQVFQQNFVMALGAVVAVIVIGLLYAGRKRSGSVRLALTGAIMLLLFVVMRAALFNKFDSMPGAFIAGVPIDHLLENLAILLVAAGALMAERGQRR